MNKYSFPDIILPDPVKDNEIVLVANGDLRQSANEVCWPAQTEMEAMISEAFRAEGYDVKRAHPFSPDEGHGFIKSQRMGMDIFMGIHPQSRLIVAEAVWQYSHHVLAGLRDHQGPILTIANWSGQWPGLVGLLNLNACLTKMGIAYSTIWSEDFTDEFFLSGIREWLRDGKIVQNAEHVHAFDPGSLPDEERVLGEALAKQLQQKKAILGVFDEGCMGMFNAIIEDNLINPMGIYKERLSQSALVAEMQLVTDHEAQAVFDWIHARGVKFSFGSNPQTDLTKDQVLQQCKMYIAATRISHIYGCASIGIQYQQGLKDMTPASDLVEGLLNNVDRPPVFDTITGEELYTGQALPHFNEADEGAAVDMLVTNRVWCAMGLNPVTTLHDIRWGEHYQDKDINEFVWLLQISGAAPAEHLIGGYSGAISDRQPQMFFPLGGGTLKGVGKPGEIVWSRVFVKNDTLHVDLGRGQVVELPIEETHRRWQQVTPQWPIVHTILYGVTRDQHMARHKANHINIAYAPDVETADEAMAVKAAMMYEMGLEVHLCGV
jgi:hypothetical protein